jgi:hypothetical protein
MTRKPLAFPALSVLFLHFCLIACVAGCFAAPSFCQSTTTQSRIALPIDDSNLVTLHGNTSPYATAAADQGAVDPALTMHRMLLLLQRSPAQEASLEGLMQEQQDKTSPNFHQWLTPQQFGAQFGPSQDDIQTVTFWLMGHGFKVNSVAQGGILIDFTGTAAQVTEAFHTPIHKYALQGKSYYANAQDPQIPAALSQVVAGVRSLHNFPARALNHSAGVFHRDPDTGRVSHAGPLPIPQFNPGPYECGLNGGPCELLGPFDLATIYNITPAWTTQGIDGTGEIIAISGETDINPADWTTFWSMFGVTQPKGKLNIIVNGPDPGIVGDEPEADIDTQWSSAVAKGATIDYVESQATETTLGVDLSAEYIVDNNIAGVMSESYGICELYIGTSGNTFYNTLWQQAAAQGITVFISSGDQGSAVCDRDEYYAENGLAVNGFGSTPYNVSVGGTDFNDGTTASKYWNTTNNTTNSSNAKGYIPEETWNDSCTNAEVFPLAGVSNAEQSCNNAEVQENNLLTVAGGSGGVSNCTESTGQTPGTCSGGYAKPAWQTGTGVPSDGKRDLPDVSLFASNGFNGTFYIICQSDAAPDACDLNGNIQGYGGTSVSSPAWAGIMALIEQKTGERQGNANYVFYKMAGTAQNSCNSNSPTSSCVFYDIPVGSTIAQPCATGSVNCKTTQSGDAYGVLTGYATTSGYDLATGLGSVNVANLVTQWSTYSGAFKGSKFSAFTLGPPTTITHGQAMPATATVVPQTGTGTPTGTIVLETNNGTSASGQLVAPQSLALTAGSLAAGATTTFLPGGTSYSVTAHYSGDGTYAPADSTPVTVTVNPEASKTASVLVTYNGQTGQTINSNATSVVYGSLYLLRTNVTNSTGNLCAPNDVALYDCPTGALTVKDTYNGTTSALDGGAFPLNPEGYAEDQFIFLSGGQHTIAASYGGDKSFNASAGSAAITVTKAATTINLNGVPSTLLIGDSVSAYATITASGVYMPGGEPNSAFPADSVVFYDNGTALTGPISYQTSQSGTGVSATATFTITPTKSGNHSITAQFQGDANYSGSGASAASAVDVQYGTYETITSSSPTISHGGSVTFTATVNSTTPGGPGLTGTVQFSTNSGNIGGPVTLANGQAQVTTSSLPGGTVFVYAFYSGDTNYQSFQANFTETVNLLGTNTAVSTSNASITQGTSVTLTATVAPATPGGPAPTGTVQFGYEPYLNRGLYSVGSPVTLTNGTATLTTTAIATGTQYVGATYSGDANFNGSTGTTAENVVAAPTFSVVGNPALVTIGSPGLSGSTTLTFTAANGFTGTIPLTAADCSGLPSEAACVFGAASVTVGSSGTATANLTITTTAPSSSVPSAGPSGSDRMRLLMIALGAAFAMVLVAFAAGQMPARRRKIAFAVLALAMIATFSSCGGGGGGDGCKGCVANPGTPVGGGSVTITFNGAGVTPAPTTTININLN